MALAVLATAARRAPPRAGVFAAACGTGGGRRAFADYKPDTATYDGGAKSHGRFAGTFRPQAAELPGLRKQLDGLNNASKHNAALANIANEGKIRSPEDLVRAFKDRRARLRVQNAQKQQEDIFLESTRFLRAGERWTFGNMAAYQRKVLDLMGATGWRRRMSADDPSVLHLEKELKVLEAMTPVELASNHKKVFTVEAVKLIAERSGATEKFVNQVLMEHDILRADRKWYAILEQFNKPLPRSFEDRQHMAEYDRPFSESETDMRDEMMDKERDGKEQKKPPRVKNVFYRKPTCGGNRWSTHAPRWYPARWKTRPERVGRHAAARGAPQQNIWKRHGTPPNQAYGRLAGVPHGGKKR